MNGNRTPEEKLDRLVDALIEETLAMPDHEILADVAEGGDELERALRSEIEAAIATHRREQLFRTRSQ